MKRTKTMTTKIKPTKEPLFIDVTPKWEDIALSIATLAVDGITYESRKIGREELFRMAKLADKWVEHSKKNSQ